MCWLLGGLELGGSHQRHLQHRVHPTSTSLEKAGCHRRTASSLYIERVVGEQCWTERAGCRDRWQASDEQGRGGRSFRVTNGHSSAFGVFFLEFGVSGIRINFFDILCTFSQVSITLGGVVVVMWSSGGGCHVGCGRAQKLRHAQKHHRARYRVSRYSHA
jgi:hypothetical protein